eukprot:SAG11_NODE_37393_length_257_cov_0.651899_1_plen_49_part_01
MRYVITNGRVLDPANGVDMIADVAIEGGKIAAVAAGIDTSGGDHGEQVQ